jgi:hypothetical protein
MKASTSCLTKNSGSTSFVTELRDHFHEFVHASAQDMFNKYWQENVCDVKGRRIEKQKKLELKALCHFRLRCHSRKMIQM